MSRGRAIGAGFVVLVLVVVAAIVAKGSPKPAAYTSPPIARSLERVKIDTTRVVPVSVPMRLLHTGKPLTVAVVGDSTGAGPDRWVLRVAAAWHAQTGRPVDLYPWDVNHDRYGSLVSTPGSGVPIVIYNGSATGKASAYSETWLDRMVPTRPDLVIINHGHNEPGTVAAESVETLLIGLRAQYPAAAFAVVEQNPEAAPRDPLVQAQKVRAIAAQATAEQATVIDVFDAFGSDRTLLISDGVHPSTAGSQVEADVVLRALR